MLRKWRCRAGVRNVLCAPARCANALWVPDMDQYLIWEYVVRLVFRVVRMVRES